ncbi:MAG TPA: VanZ family protein [Segetibacter sp.]|nr:VanZ family protein [Segetibacter sp.]
MRFTSFLPAIFWFIISVVLLALPGNDLPHSDLFNIPFFDKYIHTIMFFVLTVLFCYPFILYNTSGKIIKSWFFKITISAIVYGIIMEFVQKYLVYGRSFDVIDIVFDAIGSVAGLIVINRYFNKKIGPNRNRGRNQN